MKEEELKILQTAILLLDNGQAEVLKNGLLPYLKKAEKIVKIIKE
jgi:hypothetical protein